MLQIDEEVEHIYAYGDLGDDEHEILYHYLDESESLL